MLSKINEKNRIEKRALKVLIIFTILALMTISIFIFWGLNARNFSFNFPRRAKKILAMILVSYCIGYSSTSFQTITENRILTPSVMGLDSLYLFIQTFITFAFGAKRLILMDSSFQFIISVFIMILVSWFIHHIIYNGENRNIYTLILIGMVLGSLFRGTASFMQLLIDPNEFSILQGKMFASFKDINEKLLLISIIIALLTLIFSFEDIRKFDVLFLGKDIAISLGVNYVVLVRKTLLFISIMVSISTALVGPTTFLGILLVSFARELLKINKHSYRIIGAILIGIIALSFGQFLSERVFSGRTTLSVILNFVGGIYFIYILLKESKK